MMAPDYHSADMGGGRLAPMRPFAGEVELPASDAERVAEPATAPGDAVAIMWPRVLQHVSQADTETGGNGIAGANVNMMPHVVAMMMPMVRGECRCRQTREYQDDDAASHGTPPWFKLESLAGKSGAGYAQRKPSPYRSTNQSKA